MATNPTNSTTVSILNLPKAQLATPTDYIVLQTTNGTQIISFNSFNVVKTDIYGNATIVGDLTGNNAVFQGGINTITLTASQYYTQGGQKGFTPVVPNPGNYYDSFTIANGLIISATPTSSDYNGNPIYVSLSTQLTALSTSLTTQISANSATCIKPNLFDGITTVTIAGGNNSNTGTILNIPSEIISLDATRFTIQSTTSKTLSTLPYITGVHLTTNTNAYGSVAFTVNNAVYNADVAYAVRLLVSYNKP